jgi:hypothetical protein
MMEAQGMSAVLEAVSAYGLPTVAAAVAIYVLLKGEFSFRSPSKRDRR